MKEFTISYDKPRKPASSDTVSRWMKEKLGIRMNLYKTHSCWSAYTSKARNNGVSITDFSKQGC